MSVCHQPDWRYDVGNRIQRPASHVYSPTLGSSTRVTCLLTTLFRPKITKVLGLKRAPQPSAMMERRPNRKKNWLLLLCILLATVPLGLLQADQFEAGGVELSPTIQQNLGSLQSGWQRWLKAFSEGDRSTADSALEDVLRRTDYLGLAFLPDLSVAASAASIHAAEAGDFERAHWGLEAAESLDPGIPETALAESTVRRLEGDWPGALAAAVRGLTITLSIPRLRHIWTANLVIWGVFLLLLTGMAFLVLQVAVKGSGLFYDLGRLVSPPLPRSVADVVAILLLVWPLFLPHGVLWLLIYWSILIWGYGSVSEKGILVLLWMVLAASPTVINAQRRAVQLELTPPVRLLENLSTRRLHGNLFADLDVLRSLTPDNQAVRELTADLHRRFGQWESARGIYVDLLSEIGAERAAAPVENNLGVYYHRNGEYDQALQYFDRALNLDPNLTEAHFNTAQSHAEKYDFQKGHAALAEAKRLDSEQVERWQEASGQTEAIVIPVDGGLRRIPEIRTALIAQPEPEDGAEVAATQPAWMKYLSFLVMIGALLLAVVSDFLRQKKGYPSKKLKAGIDPRARRYRILRILVPGWCSIAEGRGFSAFFAILLPMALVTKPLMSSFGYRLPLALDSSGQWVSILCTVLFLFWLAIRFLLSSRPGRAEAS